MHESEHSSSVRNESDSPDRLTVPAAKKCKQANDKVKKLPGIEADSVKKLIAEEIKTIRDLEKKQLQCKRESDANSFVNYMKQFGLNKIYAEHCEKELNGMPSWACEIKEEDNSDSDSDVIYVGNFSMESGLQRTFKPEDNTEMNESNENSYEQQSIWRGILEWKDLRTKDPSQIFKEIPCAITSNATDGVPEVKLEDWPPKLTMQLLPKTLISSVNAEYLNNTTSVLIHPTLCSALEGLTKRMSNDFVGCVQFRNATKSDCDLKMLIVLYSQDKKMYLGFLPNEQGAFMEQLFSLIQQRKENSIMRKGSPEGLSETGVQNLESRGNVQGKPGHMDEGMNNSLNEQQSHDQSEKKIKPEKFTEDIEIIDLDEIDDDNSQNSNVKEEPANEPSSHPSSALPETREKLDSIAQSADSNSNSKSKPTSFVGDKQSIRVKSISELIPNNDLNSASASTSESSNRIIEHNPENIHAKPTKPSHSKSNVEGGEFSKQIAKENDKIQNINSSVQKSSMNQSTQSLPVNKTTKKRSLVQDNKSNQGSQRENFTVVDNTKTQNRENSPGHNSSVACSKQGSGEPKKPRTIPAKSMTGIADKLLKKQLTNSRNKNNASDRNENFNEVVPSTSSKDNSVNNLSGINSSQSLEQTMLPSTSSDLHSSDSLQLKQAIMLSLTSFDQFPDIQDGSSVIINPGGIRNNVEESYPPAFPGMLSTNHNNEGSNFNINNAPAPESVQKEVPVGPHQRQGRAVQRRTATKKRRRWQKVKTLSNGVRVTPSSNPERLNGVGPEGSAKLLVRRIKTIGALKKKQREKGPAFVLWLEDDVRFTRVHAEACDKQLKEIRWIL